MSPGFYIRSFSIFCNLGLFKVPWSERSQVPGISKSKIPLVSYSSCFHFFRSFISYVCSKEFSLLCFLFVCFALFSLLRATCAMASPQQWWCQTVLYFYPWIAIMVNCNGLSAGMMFLSTKGLGAGGKFTHVDWAACS